MTREMSAIMRFDGLGHKNLYNSSVFISIMPAQDTSDIKEKIIIFLKQKGPSLPVHIAKEIGSSILFTSAFLSELLSEKRLKMSNMRIGSSPLFFIQEQEPMLEKFSHYLKSREKDAFTILKEKKFLKDSEQEPAIRVALREIKDFAVPFRKNEEIIWKFFTIPEVEFVSEKKPVLLTEDKPSLLPTEKTTEKEDSPIVIEPVKEIKKAKEKKKTKTTRKKFSSKTKTDEKFLTKVKEFLSKNSIEIIGIEGLKMEVNNCL